MNFHAYIEKKNAHWSIGGSKFVTRQCCHKQKDNKLSPLASFNNGVVDNNASFLHRLFFYSYSKNTVTGHGRSTVLVFHSCYAITCGLIFIRFFIYFKKQGYRCRYTHYKMIMPFLDDWQIKNGPIFTKIFHLF